MAIFYKGFQVFRTGFVSAGFVLGFLMLLTVPCFSAFAQSSLYTVDQVSVDAQAENALKAREKAFEEAQVQAFNTLAQRMLSEGELSSFKAPEVSAISTLVQDFEVRNEKLSATRYSAVYTFRFKENSVKRYFNQRGSSYTDVAHKPVLILPFLETEDGPVLWKPSNVWMQAWNATAQAGGLVPIIVPIGDLADVNDIGDDEVLTYSARRLGAMLERYGASEAVVAFARPQPSGGLEVQIYRTDRARPEYVHQVLQPSLDGFDDAALYKAAAGKVREVLRKDWKSKTVVRSVQAPEAMTSGALQARVQFYSLNEWAGYQRALQRATGIVSINLKALSPREAFVELVYQGGMERLRLALAQADLDLGGPVQGAGSLLYDLRWKRAPVIGAASGGVSPAQPQMQGPSPAVDGVGQQPPAQTPYAGMDGRGPSRASDRAYSAQF